MAFDYSGMAATASRLIARFGVSCTVRDITGETHNPVTGAVTGGANADTTVNAVLTEITSENYPDAVIQAGDKRAVLDGPIAVDNQLIHDSEAWKCVSVREVKPGDTSLVWFAQVRK